jgi:Dyp-type peroxidase family
VSAPAVLELDDIQSGVLRPRPSPYAATYLLLRIDAPRAGQELVRRVRTIVASAAPESPAGDAWVTVAFTFRGLEALAVPRASLDSFPPEFREGMAARAALLGDTGPSSPEHWEKPLGTPDVHVVITVVAPDAARVEALLGRTRTAYDDLAGVRLLWRQACHALPNQKEAFGYRDGISHPAIEGSGIPGTNPAERPLKAGEFVIGYPDEMGAIQQVPRPEVLRRNGTYAVFRKLHQRVAAFRRFLEEHADGPEEEERLAAKMMGRWRSGAPLALSPERDDPALGADPARNNAFAYHDDDKLGLKTPPGSHVRRMNPRDAIQDSGTSVRIHRMIRRGTSYGPPLPEGVLEDDGVDRGLMFAFLGAHLRRQFEFVQSTWLNAGSFITASGDRDPIAGASDEGSGCFTIPRRPVRRRLEGLPRFVVTRGGEYCFVPGLRALAWLANLGGGGA